MFSNLLKKFSLARNTAVFESRILFCTQNVRLYSESKIPQSYTHSLLKDYGFTDEEAFSLISKKPVLLSLGKSLRPKLDFFKSVKMSVSDVRLILTLDPGISRRSIQNQIKPNYEYLMRILKTEEDVNFSIRRSIWLLRKHMPKCLEPNLAVLRECGVPSEKIEMLLKTQPRSFIKDPDKFAEIVKDVQKMGFDPSTSNFVLAVQMLTRFSKSSIQSKEEIYKKWGWSDEDIIGAFKRAPNCMAKSAKKIDAVLNFLVNEMGWNVSQVAGCHYVVMYSLEDWTKPRCLIYQFLLSKGLIKETPLIILIKMRKEEFSATYVVPYSAQFPELLTFFESTSNKS